MKKIFLIIILFIAFGCMNNPSVKSIEHVESVGSKLNDKEQIYIINTLNDTIISCLKGTKIYIPKNSFQTDFPRLKLKVKEFYKLKDMISNNLITVSNNKLLSTNGMLKIEAVDEKSNQVNLLNDIVVIFPTKKKENYWLFYADTINGRIDWRLDFEADGRASDPRLLSIQEQFKESNLFRIKNLGLINSDKYIDSVKTVDIKIEIAKSNVNATYYLVIKDLNCISQGEIENENNLKFKNIPYNSDVVLIGLGCQQEKITYSILEFNSSKTNIKEIPNFEYIKKTDLDTKFTRIFGNKIV